MLKSTISVKAICDYRQIEVRRWGGYLLLQRETRDKGSLQLGL